MGTFSSTNLDVAFFVVVFVYYFVDRVRVSLSLREVHARASVETINEAS